MKTTFLFILILIPTITYTQTEKTFSDLRGLDDNQGYSHLFFRIIYSTSEVNYRDIYHLNDIDNNMSVFLEDFYPNHHYIPGKQVYSYDFWGNDPVKYINSGLEGLIYFGTTDGYISRFNGISQPPNSLSISGLLISHKDGSRVYCYANPQSQEYISNDSGYTWTSAPFSERIGWINKYNDEFYSTHFDVLLKSSDQGITFLAADSQFVETEDFSNDADSIHIYRTAHTYPPLKYHLVVSDSNGNYGSWYSTYASLQKIIYSSDASQSGHIYLADGNVIRRSTDFGNTFTDFYVMNTPIIGIYKKPSSNILYTMDSYKLYKFIDTIPTIIKSLDPVNVEDESGQITHFNLLQNYPNPFNPSTRIEYQVSGISHVTLKIYDVLGNEIATLVDEEKAPGNYEENSSPQLSVINLQAEFIITN